jgi:hypothetical protein
MANSTSTITDLSPTRRKESDIFAEVNHHNQIGFQETDNRASGRNRIGSISFNEADEMFRSWINEEKWPYDAIIFDPRVFTFIFEKTARLIANKPKGRLTPREGSDILAAKMNNILLDYQWDLANHGGSMIAKWAMMDMNARKYGASFALCKWWYEMDREGKCVFDGPDMTVLNNRDIAHELSATAIEGCNWFQVRQYPTFQELERINDSNHGKPVYKNLDQLREAIGKETVSGGGGDMRSSNWTSRNRAISQIELDPVGRDIVFKTVEIVTEYRRDRWITFAPKYGVVIRDIPNPYGNYELPITMLRYYAIDDDLYGLSEIEPVKGLQKAINALTSQYLDEINQNLYSPIAIGPGVRQHTLEWGKGARWIMNNPNSDFRLVESRSNAAQFFQQTYSVLVAAMMNALGESSLGISNIQPMQNDKTATEVKALQIQRNARDQFNQIFLSEAIKRQMKLWHSMNQRLLFSDPTKAQYIMRIAGKDAIQYFIDKGLSDMVLPDEAVQLMAEQGTRDPDQYMIPKYPVDMGADGKKDIQPKLKLEERGKSGRIVLEPDDLTGEFDFAVDVTTMSVNSDDMLKEGRTQAINALLNNPNTMQFLQMEGFRPKVKDLLVSWFEDLGFSDADRYFEKAAPNAEAPAPDGGASAGGPPPGGAAAGTPPSILPPGLEEQPFAQQNLGAPNSKVLSQLQGI